MTNIQKVLLAFLQGMKDYTTDIHGDVGSWVREAGMKGINRMVLEGLVLPSPSKNSETGFTKGIPHPLLVRIVSSLLRQSAERLDRVREASGIALKTLISKAQETPKGISLLPSGERIQVALSSVKEEDGGWRPAEIVLPALCPLLEVPDYRQELLAGWVCSCSGVIGPTQDLALGLLTDQISKGKTDDEMEEGNHQKGGMGESEWATEISEMYKQYGGNARVIGPLLEVTVSILDIGLFSTSLPFLDSVLDFALDHAQSAKDIRRLVACMKM